MIRALVDDDEALARQITIQMLSAHADVVVVGESASGTSALRDIRELRPDLVLLDVQMPGMDGFEVLRNLDPHEIPEIIFVTAFEAYALRAFDVHALDYLLKPFDEQRLAAALARARKHLLRDDRLEDTRQIIALLEELNRKDRYAERLAVRSSDRTVLLPVRDIDLIQAEGKYLHITAGKARHTIRERLYHLGSMLDPKQFARLSRSVIVNISSIREVRSWARGEYLMVMRDGTQVTSTRAYREELAKLLELGDEH
jgi:two-component system, LytTR family, response regulator